MSETIALLPLPPSIKMSLTLDERQRHAALLIASGELDVFLERVDKVVGEIAENRTAYLHAVLGVDRDAAFAHLMAIAGGLERVESYARAVARGEES